MVFCPKDKKPRSVNAQTGQTVAKRGHGEIRIKKKTGEAYHVVNLLQQDQSTIQEIQECFCLALLPTDFSSTIVGSSYPYSTVAPFPLVRQDHRPSVFGPKFQQFH